MAQPGSSYPAKTLRQLWDFLQDFLPAQKSQIVLALGALLLLLSDYLRWFPLIPRYEISIFGRPGDEILGELQTGLQLGIWLARYCLILMGVVASVVLLFLPRQQVGRRIRRWVILPCAAAAVLYAAQLVLLLGGKTSVMESTEALLLRHMSAVGLFILNGGPGLHAFLAGLILVSVGTWRVARGLTALPIRFRRAAGEREAPLSDTRSTRNAVIFTVLVLAVPQVLGEFVATLVFRFAPLPTRVKPGDFLWVEWPGMLLGSAVPAICAVVLLGKKSKQALGNMLRGGRWRYYLLAVGLPLLVVALPRAILYIAAKIRWDFGRPNVPWPLEASKLFILPPWWALLFLLLALLEEIGWRGYLQPLLKGMVGLKRAIFLVGLIWGAFHLPAVSGQADAIAFPFEIPRQHLPYPRVVVDHEDVLGFCL